jgi:probable H4MPT-linked C1 transfer pathway protein
LALATVAGRLVPKGAALLIDIGSTTTDIVPIRDGVPVPDGRTDPQRLRAGELVYAGISRTPLCAILGLAVAAELFATTGDVCRVLGALPEDPNDCNTADGRPATIAASHARLARMLCADLETSTELERRWLAERVVDRLSDVLGGSIKYVAQKLPGSIHSVLLAGSGSFLAQRVLLPEAGLTDVKVINLGKEWGPAASVAACARAVALLASEEDGGSP